MVKNSKKKLKIYNNKIIQVEICKKGFISKIYRSLLQNYLIKSSAYLQHSFPLGLSSFCSKKICFENFYRPNGDF